MPTRAETDLLVRDITLGDLAGAHALSRQLNWMHRPEDWELMLRTGMGVVAEGEGEIVGTLLGWPYTDRFGNLGMVMVAEGWRRRGVATRMIAAMQGKMGGRTLRVTATAPALPIFTKLGYQTVGTIHQHQGTAFTVPIAPLSPGERVRPMTVRDVPLIIELDRRSTGIDRTQVLQAVLENARGVVLERAGEAVGFGLFRRFGREYAIGPVVAPHERGAKLLITHWLGSRAGMFIRVDVPGDSGLSEWLGDMGLGLAGRETTMVLGEPAKGEPPLAPFAILSQAFG